MDAHEALDLFDIGPLIRGREGNRFSCASRTRGAANAVYVIFGLIRKIKINDEFDSRHVNATCRDVRRDQHAIFS